MTPAALLFAAGLGIGAVIVSMMVGPSDEGTEQVAAEISADDNPIEPASRPPVETSAPRIENAPAAVAELPAAPAPAAPAPPPTSPATKLATPAVPAAPASEPAPPVMEEPGSAIDEIITAAVPPVPPLDAIPEFAAEPTEPAPDVVSGPLPKRVSIHYPRSAEGEARAAQAELRAAGITDVKIMPVNLAIGHSNVRFYHAADSEAADSTSAILADTLDGAPQSRDFTDYPTPTLTGTVEIWLAGESSREASVGREPSPSPSPSPAAETRDVEVVEADPYVQPAPGDQVREVQRILLDRLAARP